MAGNYHKSPYTGAQIDQVVGKILSGEVDAAADRAQASAQTAAVKAGEATAQAGYAAGAAQAVKDALDNLPAGAVPVINDLTTGGTTAALSAQMGKALNEALLNKVNERGYLTTEQFNATDYNFPYTASIGSYVTGTPKPDYYNVLYLPLKDTPGYGTQVISNVNEPGRLFLRQSITNGMWEPWIPIATATPPEEHDLPLAEGWSATEISSFSKDQFGRVHVAIHAIAETAAAGDRIISTLPVGFHAKAVQRYACVFMDGASGFAFASPYGAIGVYAYSPTRDVCLQLDFEAVYGPKSQIVRAPEMKPTAIRTVSIIIVMSNNI